MRTGLAICLVVMVVTFAALRWEVETRDRRIVQLEMALAQAHAHADSLEALTGIGGAT